MEGDSGNAASTFTVTKGGSDEAWGGGMEDRSLTTACSVGSAGMASFSTTATAAAAAGVSSTLGSPGGVSSTSVFCY